MDVTNSSNASTTCSRAKSAKKRNSDVRKEQNRIASRAYREKRKQKLALLDEILKTDSQTDSMSSVSDETEGYTAAWSLAQSRHASGSPVPAALSTVPTTAAQWSTTGPPMPSVVPEYGHDSYDGWTSYFGRSGNAFPASNDYTQQFVLAEVGGHSLDTASSYNLPSIPSMTSGSSTPPMPPISLDPLLATSFQAQPHHTQPLHISSSSNLPSYGGEDLQRQLWIDSLDDNSVLALKRFGGLSYVQQRQVLATIQEKRHVPRNTSHDQNSGFIYPTCQATPPPSAHFISTDFRKYQSMRQASNSPIPRRHH
ncbi:hypothetical protein GGR52DRAFT_354321 [Hypoxylon sp. FL1284]|nr:hypothetical protein GGR52DRAFT_354321 [Hypoxylon sp. FL1284]